MTRSLLALILSAIVPFIALAKQDLIDTSVRPGRVGVWKHDEQSIASPTDFKTVTVETTEIPTYLEDFSDGMEMVIFLTSSDSLPTLSLSAVADSIANAPDSMLMPYVYHPVDTKQNELKSLGDTVRESKCQHNAQKLSLPDLQSLVKSTQVGINSKVDTTVMNNGVIDSYEVNLSGDDSDMEILREIIALTQSALSSMMLIAIDEPSSNAFLPKNDGNYRRVLADTTSTVGYDWQNKYYKPEGAEYSIYYAATYLYITPDIFTGLITGIFCWFVVLTGLSCLNNIQGASTFVHKAIPIGKEN